MVAADSSKPYFLGSVRLATGAPEAMNSVTAAYRTERARLGRELTPQIWLGPPCPVKPGTQTARKGRATETKRGSKRGPRPHLLKRMARRSAKSLTVFAWTPMISVRQKSGLVS